MNEDLLYNSNKILQSDYGVSFSATLMKGYYFINGDEQFYKFTGKNAGLSLTELLWDEDVANFVEALDNLHHGPQVFMGRVKSDDNSYYSLIIMMTYTGKVIDDFQLIDVDMFDFASLKSKYTDYVANNKRNVCLFSLLPNIFLDYTLETDELIIYKYINQRPAILFKNKLKEYMEEHLATGLYTQEDRISFYNFYENLRDDAEQFETTIPAKSIQVETSEGYYKFRCTSFYENGVKTKKIGVIERSHEVRKNKVKYYLTENAYDVGTGIFNKRAINEYAIDKVKEANRNNKAMYIAILDVDDFKKFNDTYGHMFGDVVLSKIASIIRQNINIRGAVGRIGGDEYMIVFDQVDNEESIRNIIKTIRKNISYAFIDENKKIDVTTSWGVSRFPDDGQQVDELFKKADKSLYIAKEKGKDRFIIYSEEKHGNIAITDTEKRSVGFHNLLKPAEKGKVVTTLLLKLSQSHDKDTIINVLETIREYFDIDGIAIYKGVELDRIYEVGKYIEPIQKLGFIKNDEYLSLFDENGLFSENVLTKVRSTLGSYFKYYEKQEVGKLIQAKAGEDEKMTVVSFDFFNRTPKVSEEDFAFVGILGTFLANLISIN